MIGVTVSGFDRHIEQLSILDAIEGENHAYEKRERAEKAVESIRGKYGYASLQRGIVLTDEKVSGLDIRGKKD